MVNNKNLTDINMNRILVQEANFAYLLPCEELSHLISNFTITFPNKAMISDDYTIMPHGSVTLVIFSYHTKIHSFLFGPTTRPVKVGNLANKCDCIFIIEFQPAGFYPFTKLNQKILTDKILPFSTIDYALYHSFQNIFLNSTSVEELLTSIEKELLQNMHHSYPKELSIAMQSIIQTKGVKNMKDISDNAHYSVRHLNRLFHLYLGMSIKSFSKLVRINKSIQLLNTETHTLSFICEELGYYDVSHFIKDFKTICSITPQEYKLNMSDYYSEIAKF